MILAETGIDLQALFGAATPWIAGSVVLFLAVLIGIGFIQGRPLSILSLTVGARPKRHRRESARAAAAVQPVGDRREYDVANAGAFYQEIALHYDLRNSGNLVSTHLATVKRLQALRVESPSLSVLDLGGGTGQLIAIHFFNDPAVTWTYVDFCPNMAALFRQNLTDTALGQHAEILVEDLTQAPNHLEPASYDVILLSFVLSSMPYLPSFPAIARLLKPGGSLIITDINPGYTRDKPFYEVVVDAALVALQTTPVDPFEVIRRAQSAGLRPTELTPIGGGSTYYSFITVFTPITARPVPGHGDNVVIRA
jgi:ubiquinone/menaquinone biosynthesis C-methylase UbiE